MVDGGNGDPKHLISQDVKRVASELGHVPTRAEYTQYGKYNKHAIDTVFGTWTLALQACGLKEPRNPFAAKFEKQVAKYADKQFADKKYLSEVAPYAAKFSGRQKGKNNLIVFGSDFHSQWADPFCLHVFLDFCLQAQPDTIILGGDIFDFYQISRFNKNPMRQMHLQEEIDYIKKHLFIPLRMACPDSQIDFILGNHEARLFNYLCSQAPGLASLESLQFDKLFSLETYKINLVARPTWLTPNTKDQENYKIYDQCFVAAHGVNCGTQHATNELNKFGLSGTSGHVHHLQTQTKRDLHGLKTWISTGCMASLKSGEEYIPDLVRWNQGFNVIHIWNEQAIQNYIQFADGFANVCGTFYYREQCVK